MPELIQTEPTDPLAQPLLTSLAAGYRARYGRYAGHPHCISFEKTL